MCLSIRKQRVCNENDCGVLLLNAFVEVKVCWKFRLRRLFTRRGRKDELICATRTTRDEIVRIPAVSLVPVAAHIFHHGIVD